jgi:hypothetical protein
MLLLATAAVFHVAQRRLVVAAEMRPRLGKASGAVGLALWIGVALAGCAYILVETD